MKHTPFSILHVEAGPTFGGSTSALESYLLYGDGKGIVRNVLFHYRVPGVEAIEKKSHRFTCLNRRPPGERRGGIAGQAGQAGGERPGERPEAVKKPARSGARPGKGRGRLGRLLRAVPGARASAKAVRALASLLGVELPLAVRVAGEARACGCDLIHSNNTPTIQKSTLIAAAIARRPCVTHVRTGVTLGPLERYLINRCRLVIAQSSSVKRELEEQGVRARVVECFDGVPIPAEPLLVSGQVKAELLGTAGDDVIGAVGRLVERKGLRHLIEAMPQLIERRGRVTLAIVGDGPLGEGLRGRAASLGIADRIRFLGFRRDLRYVLQAIDVYALPSLREGLPIALLAAMAEGRPVVASSVDGVPAFVHHERTGLLVPPGDPAALGEALARLLDDRSLAARLGRAGRLLVAREASVKTTAARVDGYLREALGDRVGGDVRKKQIA